MGAAPPVGARNGERCGVDADRVVAALERSLLTPRESIEKRWDWPDAVAFRTSHGVYDARPVDWLIAGEPWVDRVLRVVLDMEIDHVPVDTYGLLFDREGNALLLSEVATMRALGRRLGEDVDPLAYAELLAELYSGRDIAGPVVAAPAVTESSRAGWLVRDVGEVLAKYPWIEASSLALPVVRRVEGGVELEFDSCHYFFDGAVGAVDVLRWTVVGGPKQEVSWSRRYVVERLERP
jgi:hypothetical protein